MKTVSKKLLSLLLVAILLVSAIPFQAFADPCPEGSHDLSGWMAVSDERHYKVCVNTECPQHGAIIVYAPHEYTSGDDNKCDTEGCGWVCTHSNTEIRNKVDATCTTPGYTGDTYCTYCQMKVSDGSATALGAHNFRDGICTVCQAECQHPNKSEVPNSGKQPTCVEDGYEPKKVCDDCGKEFAGATLRATGAHVYDAATNKCLYCPATRTGAAHKLTLNAMGGKVNNASSITVDVTEGDAIPYLPDAYLENYTFGGWYTDLNDPYSRVNAGQAYTWQTDMTVYAKLTRNTEVLTVRRVLNGDFSTAKTIYTADVPTGTKLLTEYLSPNVTDVVNRELALTPGYSWENEFWRDYSGTQPLTSQNDRMDQAQTVFVNFVSNSYKLYFNADGGTVTPANKSVVYGSKVGTLPTPYKNGSVFMGWKDASGNIYTADTVYNVAGDTSLTAVWQDEALVILYIYINGDFSTCNRMIVMDGYVKNNNISRDDVFAEVAKYYTPASGTLKIAGLFDEYTWGSYRTNTSKAGTPNVEITAARPNRIYVMVSNASTGTTVIPTTPTNPTVPANGFWVRDLNGNLIWYPAGSSLPAGSGYWILDANGNPNIWVITSGSIIPTYIYTGTNPKTGDTAQIEIAAAVMVLAAAALITIMALRKKKSV